MILPCHEESLIEPVNTAGLDDALPRDRLLPSRFTVAVPWVDLSEAIVSSPPRMASLLSGDKRYTSEESGMAP